VAHKLTFFFSHRDTLARAGAAQGTKARAVLAAHAHTTAATQALIVLFVKG
jgi:hypothetical protein